MKKCFIIILLLVGAFSLSSCNATQANQKTDTTSKNDQKANSTTKGNPPMSKVSEKDIVKKTKENINGIDVTKYELKDGSIILNTGDEDDLSKLNEAIENSNNQKK